MGNQQTSNTNKNGNKEGSGGVGGNTGNTGNRGTGGTGRGMDDATKRQGTGGTGRNDVETEDDTMNDQVGGRQGGTRKDPSNTQRNR